jgi:hypothetical protein
MLFSTMKYRVFFHSGDELTLKAKVSKGRAWLDELGLHVEGPGGLTIASSDILKVELYRLHGLGRVIRLEHRGGRLFLSVVRLMIGQFALINYFQTGDLHGRLAVVARSAPGQ